MEPNTTTRTEEETLRALLRRADALNAAYMAVELEEWGYPAAKAETLAVLEQMRDEAGEWFKCYRRALGIPDPSDYSEDQGGVILRGAPPHNHKEEHMERHTVEVTFEGDEVSSVTDELATKTLYRTDEGTYLVHLDQRKSGEGAVLEYGVYAPGMSEHDIRVMWPELLEAQSGR
jgi:hypothetical protein